MMQESLHFVYDGIRSSEMGVIQVSTDSGLFGEQFLANKRINEEHIRGRERPYFFGVEREPLSFPLHMAFEDGFTEDDIRKVARWIDKDTYRPFHAENNPSRVFYAMSVDSSEHIHNGIQQGYLTLNMRCNSPYTYSPIYIESHEFEFNTSEGVDFTFSNMGDLNCRPHLTIRMLEEGDFSIVNYSDGGKEFKFEGLENGEIITIDNELEDIQSSLDGVYRYDNFNNNYLSFPRGKNYLKIYGKCIITFKYIFKTIG